MHTSRWLVTPPAHSVAVVEAEQYVSVAEAQEIIFGGQRMTPAHVTLNGEQLYKIERASGIRVTEKEISAWRAKNGGVLFVDQVVGKHEFITYALGVNADGTVRGVEVLIYRENYGDEVRDGQWRAQFVGKAHGAELKLKRDIQNISGATLSCRHITDGIKRLLATHAIAFTG